MKASDILIVEDETALAAFYCQALEESGYSAMTVQSGEEALAVLRDCAPTLVLMDIELKGALDGFQTLARIRAKSNVPVMVITGQARSTFDLERGLDLGANNYLVKPVGRTELLARVRVELRSLLPRVPEVNGNAETESVYRYGETEIALGESGVIYGSDRSVDLGDTELRVLKRLFEKPGKVVGVKELLRIGWGVEATLPDKNMKKVVTGCLYRLRRKLVVSGLQRKIIQNVKPDGYYVVPPD